MSQRITVRLPEDLYARLVLFAQGRSQGQTPDISAIVREALEQYLTPKARQTTRQRVSNDSIVSSSYSKRERRYGQT